MTEQNDHSFVRVVQGFIFFFFFFFFFVVQGQISTALHLWRGTGIGLLEGLLRRFGLDVPWWGGLVLAVVGLALVVWLDPDKAPQEG